MSGYDSSSTSRAGGWEGEDGGLEGGAQGRWAGEEAAAKWLPSLPVSVEARTSDCSASGCETSQTANISDRSTWSDKSSVDGLKNTHRHTHMNPKKRKPGKNKIKR